MRPCVHLYRPYACLQVLQKQFQAGQAAGAAGGHAAAAPHLAALDAAMHALVRWEGGQRSRGRKQHA